MEYISYAIICNVLHIIYVVCLLALVLALSPSLSGTTVTVMAFKLHPMLVLVVVV